MILPATVGRTGGLCMPCKQGIRGNIEASKRRYEEQKKYDPYRELWSSLVQRVHKTDEGFEGLSPEERLYFAVGILDGEVHNGGFHQFFWNSSGGYYRYAASGLDELGAGQALELLQRAKEIAFGDKPPPLDWKERRTFLVNSDSGKRLETLDELDPAFWQESKTLNDKLARFAVEKGLIAPFQK